MYEFEPASPVYAISDTIVEHTMHGRDRTSADLPGGYRLTLRTRELHGPVRAALAAPSPTGNARICIARFSPVTPMPAMARVLDAVTRYAPALPDARDAHPSPQAVARLLTTGTSFQRPGKPGLFVRFGPAEAWLNGKRDQPHPGRSVGRTVHRPPHRRRPGRTDRRRATRRRSGRPAAARAVAGRLRPVPPRRRPHPAQQQAPGPRRPLGPPCLPRSARRRKRPAGRPLRLGPPGTDLHRGLGRRPANHAAGARRCPPGPHLCIHQRPGPRRGGEHPHDVRPADPPTAPDRPPSGSPHGASGRALAAEDEPYLYGVKLDLGEWGYVLDAQSVLYGPGWYPFHKHVTRREKDPAYPLNDREVPTGRTIPAPVRISPDVENFSWGNEYVQLTPVDHRIEARLRLYVGERQASTLVRTVTLEIDLRARRVALPDRIPAALRHQAETKGRRILDLLLAARRERRRGATEPWSVLEPWGRGDLPSTGT